MTENIPKCNHTSVGMIVRNGDRILLIERRKPPFGFAPPAGHVDDGEEFEAAAIRESKEEVGLDTDKLNLLIEGRKENACRRPDGSWHYWKIYEAAADNSDIKRSKDETKQADWYSMDEIRKMASRTADFKGGDFMGPEWQKSPGLEPVWCEWFKEMGIL